MPALYQGRTQRWARSIQQNTRLTNTRYPLPTPIHFQEVLRHKASQAGRQGHGAPRRLVLLLPCSDTGMRWQIRPGANSPDGSPASLPWPLGDPEPQTHPGTDWPSGSTLPTELTEAESPCEQPHPAASWPGRLLARGLAASSPSVSSGPSRLPRNAANLQLLGASLRDRPSSHQPAVSRWPHRARNSPLSLKSPTLALS